jgi:hypothetical protein
MPYEPKIYCSFTKLVPVVDLLTKQHPLNPKSHPEEQLATFREIIKANGVRRPITVSNLSGCIVAGHGLLLALADLGCVHAPVDFQDFKDEAHELAHLAADNKLADLGEVNEAAMSKVVKQIEAGGLDSILAGIVAELETPAKLKEITIQPPPKMAWVLIGCPIVDFAKVQPLLDKMPNTATMHTTANDVEGGK